MSTATLEGQFTPQLGRVVYLRPGTSDRGVWNDTFGGAGGYHVPPTEMPEPRIVLDLGANIGLTAAHYAAMWPQARILAVEMDLGNAEVARKNFEGIVFQRAVCASGLDHIVSYSSDAATEAYAISDDGDEGVRAIFLLDLVVAFFGDTVVDFCKMDIEGAEWGVLDSGRWWCDSIRQLLVELHGEPGEPSEEIRARGIAALEALGFDARHHPPHPQAIWAVRR